MVGNAKESEFPKVVSNLTKGNFVKPRNLADPSATFETFNSRGKLFRTLEKQIVPKLKTPKLISSVNGSISKLLLTIPGWVFPFETYAEPDKTLVRKYADAFRAILAMVPDTTEFAILTHQATENELASWLSDLNIESRSKVFLAPNDMDFTVWAEDAYAVSEDLHDGETFFVEPASFRRGDDALIADVVSSSSSLNSTQASLYFQGGNILIGDDFWMIGADYPAKSLELGFVVPEPSETEREAIDRVYGEYLDHERILRLVGSRVPVPQERINNILVGGEIWRELTYFGNVPGTVQPLFHIDMFISLLGRDTNGSFKVLVADPRMASDALGIGLWPHSMQQVFDDIAAQLVALGFVVERNPMPLVYDDDEDEKLRIWYFATSNNAIVQNDPKVVLIPTYGHDAWSSLSVTDQLNKEIWENNGYEVRQLPDFNPFAANLGAAHCITKFLGRGPVATN